MWWNFNLSAPYSFRTLCTCSKNTLNKNKPVLLITASMNIKVILSIIENNQCLTDRRCFWGLSIFLFQNRSIISGFVLLCRQLTLYRFPGCLNIHYHQFECRQKVKKDEDYQPQLFHWPYEKHDLCFSQQREFFRYGLYHSNSVKNT